MEITTQLPVSQWYFHDLQWWGLDYPPLTAYHSWVLGKIGSLINPAWFRLYSSRGLDDETLKVFMRATVIISEYLIYIPAAVIFVRRFSRLHGAHAWDASIALVAILMQPATILIDHVHFQYNTVMLGFVLASMSSMVAGRNLWASVFFVLALGFKQMALYYAPAVFAYLLGICVVPRINVTRLFMIALVTATSFAILLLPLFLGALYDRYRGIDARPDLEGFVIPLPVFNDLFSKLNLSYDAWYFPIIQQTSQLIYRVFPFARGLFEDKVANFWCTLNVVVKLRKYPQELLQRASLVATLAAITPPCLIVFLKPKKELLPLTLASTAWAFFMFSFQVHEKSVLLPLLPMTVLLAGKNGMAPTTRSWVGWANMLAVWTLFPLLKRVNLQAPYFVLSLLWAYLLSLPPTSFSLYGKHGIGKSGEAWHFTQWATAFLHISFYIAMVSWHVLEAFVVPPKDKPDLWVVGNVALGAVGFGICYIWCLGHLAVQSGLFRSSAKGRSGKQKTL